MEYLFVLLENRARPHTTKKEQKDMTPQIKKQSPTFRKRSRLLMGFTLIEAVLYVALFLVLIVMSMNMLLESIRAFNDLRISRDINDSSVGIMERLTRDIKSSTSIDFVRKWGRYGLADVCEDKDRRVAIPIYKYRKFCGSEDRTASFLFP